VSLLGCLAEWMGYPLYYAPAMGNIPAPGEHTDGVLARIGYGKPEI